MGMLVNPYRYAASAASQVVFLSGFEGADGATSITDESSYGHTITFHADALQAEIDTAQAKFGSSSALFRRGVSTRSYASVPDNALWDITQGDFTVEFFVRFNTKNLSFLVTQSNNVAAGASFEFGVNVNTIFFNTYSGGTVTSTADPTPPTLNTGQWYHFCADKAGSVLRVYLDGVMQQKTTYGGGATFNTSSQPLVFGDLRGFGSGGLDGWMDEVRITKGLARYASDSGFTVPTSAYPR